MTPLRGEWESYDWMRAGVDVRLADVSGWIDGCPIPEGAVGTLVGGVHWGGSVSVVFGDYGLTLYMRPWRLTPSSLLDKLAVV